MQLDQVSKTFPGGVKALDGVSLTFNDNDVTAVLGANGSGKSTLGKLLSGVHDPDKGWIRIDDRRTTGFHSPSEAASFGVRIVHQEAPLINLLSVAEAMALFSSYPTGLGVRVRWQELRRRAASQLGALGIELDPKRLCGTLTSAERAIVSLAIALGAGNARLLVLDEVTASLTEEEASHYLERVRGVATSGTTVVMITHRLGELAFADQVVMLREGKVVGLHAAGEVDELQLVAEIVGEQRFLEGGRLALGERRDIKRLWEDGERRHRARAPGAPVLEMSRVSGSVVDDVSLTVLGGEIVGLAGLRGSGTGELPLLLAGFLRRRSGTISVLGRQLPRRATPADARRLGIGFLPGDRLTSGGIGSQSVGTNVVLPELGRFWHRPKKERAAVDLVLETLDVRPRSRTAAFGTLSGGNQQKVLLGKWLRLDPSVLVLDDPTYGVDPGARQVLFEALLEAAWAGIGILMLSTEPEQLVAYCDRVLVMRNGMIACELRNGPDVEHQELSLDSLTRWAYA